MLSKQNPMLYILSDCSFMWLHCKYFKKAEHKGSQIMKHDGFGLVAGT